VSRIVAGWQLRTTCAHRLPPFDQARWGNSVAAQLAQAEGIVALRKALAALVPYQGTMKEGRRRQVQREVQQPLCDRLFRFEARRLDPGSRSAGSWIAWLFVRCMPRGDGVENIFARAETREEITTGPQPIEGGPVKGQTLALRIGTMRTATVRSLLPFQAKPAEILVSGSDKLRAATWSIEVIHPHDQRASGAAGALVSDPERSRVSHMQKPGGRRREATSIQSSVHGSRESSAPRSSSHCENFGNGKLSHRFAFEQSIEVSAGRGTPVYSRRETRSRRPCNSGCRCASNSPIAHRESRSEPVT
jgi:hypothetical protein